MTTDWPPPGCPYFNPVGTYCPNCDCGAWRNDPLESTPPVRRDRVSQPAGSPYWHAISSPQIEMQASTSNPNLRALGIEPAWRDTGRRITVRVAFEVYLPPGCDIPNPVNLQAKILEAVSGK